MIMKMHRRNFIKTGTVSIATFGFVNSLLTGCADESNMFKELENMTAGVEPLTREDYISRQEKAAGLMEQTQTDGLLITGGVNLNYFLDLSWWQSERLFGAIMNRMGEPIWICPAFELERAREVIQFGSDIRIWEEHESPYELVVSVMKDMGAGSGKLAVGPNVRNFVVEGIRKAAAGTQLQLVNGAVITENCRGIKTEKELAFMDLANRITKIAYREAFKLVKEGMESVELSSLIQEAHTRMGTSGGGYPQFGFTSSFPHGTRQQRNLHQGDVILVDGGCSVEGYRSDVTRTIVFGTPSDKQKKVFDIVLKAQQEAMKTVRPGVTCGSVDAAARKVIDDAGFGPGYKYFVHRLGHGIGLEGHEYPYLVKGNELVLQTGMTFSNEPGIYIYDEFGIRIEDCFVVTEDGGRYLGGMLTETIDRPFG